MEEDLLAIDDPDKRGGEGKAEDESEAQMRQPADELTIYQLKGIFSLQDTDKDGLITRQQLVKCLQLLGFTIRDKLLLKYLNPTGEKGKRGSPSKRKAGTTNLTAYASAKVKLSTFISVTLKELPHLHAGLEDDLRSLFSFMDPANTGQIAVKDLRHLLVDTLSSTRLDGEEFADVLQAAGLKVQSVRQERDYFVKYENLINDMLIGRRWKEVV